jgi:hypothetical protein
MCRIALLLLAGAAAADSWAAFGEREWTSPDKRYRLAGRDEANALAFRLFDGDKLLAQGTVPQLPFEVHVLACEPGAVLFEKYARIGHGVTLAFLDAHGRLRFERKLEEAIPGGAAGANRTLSSIWWHRAWWVDEPRRKVVLVAENGVLSEVDLATGKVEKPGADVVLAAFALPWAREKALEIAVELAPAGLRAAAEPLLADETLPPTTRLRAAVAVEGAGGAPLARALFDAALAEGVPLLERQAAVAFSGVHVQDLSLIEAAALRKDVGYQAVAALSRRGAVEALAGLLTHAAIDPHVRAYAAQRLGQLPAEDVLEAVDDEMGDADPAQAGALLEAAIATGAPDLAARLQHHEAVLLKVLDRQTGNLAWLGDYFQGRPTSEAVKPLLKALAAYKGTPVLRKKLIGALRTCSGEDHGDDADAWLRALGRR